MRGKIKPLIAVLATCLAGNVLCLTKIVKSAGATVSVDIDDLDGLKILVETTNQYLPFVIKIKDLYKGVYTLKIPKEEMDSLICAPTFFNITSSGKDIKIYCIAKPTSETIDLSFVRKYGNKTTSYDFTVEIKNKVVWYEVWSGVVQSGYYLTNGKYVIEIKPKEYIAQIFVKKGGNIVWSGLLFPGMEENITKDLRIKFFGVIDNVTYLKIWSTSDDKFTAVQAKPKVEIKYINITKYIRPVCKVEGDWIVFENTKAYIFYADGKNKTIEAYNKTIQIPKENVVKVICGEMLTFAAPKVSQQPQQTQQKPEKEEEQPRFLQAPKAWYYVGEPVTIVATKEFEISCTNGLYQKTRVFTYTFNEPVTCTVVLGDITRTFSVKEKPAQQPAAHTQPQQQKPSGRNPIVAILALLFLGALGVYFTFKDKILAFLGRRRGGKKPEEQKPQEQESGLEVEVKNILEGEH